MNTNSSHIQCLMIYHGGRRWKARGIILHGIESRESRLCPLSQLLSSEHSCKGDNYPCNGNYSIVLMSHKSTLLMKKDFAMAHWHSPLQ